MEEFSSWTTARCSSNGSHWVDDLATGVSEEGCSASAETVRYATTEVTSIATGWFPRHCFCEAVALIVPLGECEKRGAWFSAGEAQPARRVAKATPASRPMATRDTLTPGCTMMSVAR